MRRTHRLQRLSAKGKTLGFGIFLICSIFVVALIGSCAYNLFLLSPFSSQQKVPSPYDWSNLKTDKSGRLSYVQNGQTISRTGIDVSSHQQQINWSSVAQDGISFAYIRLGYRGSSEGTLHVDDFFTQNLSGAKNAGILATKILALSNEELFDKLEKFSDGMAKEVEAKDKRLKDVGVDTFLKG